MIETLLTALNNGITITEYQPKNNKEAYLKYLCGGGNTLPEPRTAEEVLLYKLCTEGTSGSGGIKFTGTDGAYLFAGGGRLDKINEIIGMCDGITSLYYAFYGVDEKISIDLSKLDTSKVETTKMMFAASDITKVDFSKNDFSACTEFEGMFQNCRYLEEIIGFSAPYGNLTYPVGFPKGSSSTKYKLKRLTFRTDAPCAIRSPIDVRYNSFDREGAVEMFNTLPDVTALGLPDYKACVYLAGNPCITDGTLTEEDKAIATAKGWKIDVL